MAQVNAPPTPRDRKIRRELAELAQREGFVHHVADAASGRIATTVLDRRHDAEPEALPVLTAYRP
jgi:hypothetical protein